MGVRPAVPPVLLGHGVWSNIKSLDKIEAYLKDHGYDEYLITKAWREDAAAAENPFNVDAGIIPQYIKDLKEQAASNMFSAGKVNVIVHSRGGLYTRAYIEGIQPQYYYREDINSLITLNTPHSGSQAANLVMDRRIVPLSIFSGAVHNLPPPISTLTSLTFNLENKPLGELVSLVGFPPENDRAQNWGAKNLLVETDFLSGITPANNPNFIQTLNSSANLQKLEGIPIHVVATTFEACQVSDLMCNDILETIGDVINTDLPEDQKKRIPKGIFRAIWIYNAVEFALNDVPSTVDGLTSYLYRTSIETSEPNDLIVPWTSMKAGLNGNFVSTFSGSNIAHIDISNSLIDEQNATGVTAFSGVHDKLFSLLRENVNDESGSSSFTKSGLNPPIIPYLFLAGWHGETASRNTTEVTSKIFINKDPAVFENVIEGDELNFNIYTEDLDKLMVTYENSVKNDSLIYEIRNPIVFENNMSYTIPKGYSGEITITANGYKNGIIKAIDTIHFNVNIPTSITLQGIHFENEEPIILNQDNYSYNLIGSFSDGIDRVINDFSGLTYVIEDTSIISQIDNSSIKAESVGSTILTASISDLEDSILVNVQENPTLQQTILISFYAIPDDTNSEISINWETLHEYENATFVLETSYDTPDNFTEINSQVGNGTLDTPAQFNYTDTSYGAHTHIYYRIKMIDTQGNETYSSIIEVNLNSTAGIDSNQITDITLSLYPNPTNTGNVTLKLNSNITDDNAKLEMYNLRGKRLSRQTVKVQKGTNSFNLRVGGNLSNGIYFVKISTKAYVKTVKLIVE